MDTITSELPAVLGYLALAAVLGLFVLVTYLSSSDAIATRRRNRVVRHARRGCEVCRLRLAAEGVTR